MPRTTRGSYCAIIVMVAVIAASCAAQDAAVWADHSATSCIFRVSGETRPVTYLGEPRQNPDNTYYPGDAFHYVFRWSEQSDDPAGCSVRAPLLETGRLQLDHRAVWVDSNGREDRRAPLVHRDLDPSVAFLASTDFYAGTTVASCKEMFSKPGESHTWRYDRWVVYDKVFLTKDIDRLTEFEKTLKSKGYGGEPAWGWWTDRIDTKSRHVQDLPYCPWAKYKGGNIKGGIIPEDQKLNDTTADLPDAPPNMWPYGGGIFYVTTHGWGITTGADAPHAHLVATPADPESVEWFEERVREACGGLGARSGCVYGTAEVRPDRGVCVSDVVGAYGAVLDAWHKRLPPYDVRDEKGDRVKPPPPPGYPAGSWAHLLSNRSYAFAVDTVPPGMHPEAYQMPAGGDACARPAMDGAKLELTASGHYWAPYHYANGIPVRGLEEVSRDRGPSLQDGGLSIILTKPPLHHAEGYDAKNLDGTYYHEDPIYVRHEPSWKWKDERSAHIIFETHRLPPVTLPVIDEFDCSQSPQPSMDANGTSALVSHMAVPPCDSQPKS